MTLILLFTILVNFLFSIAKMVISIFRVIRDKIKLNAKLNAKERQRRRLKYLNEIHKNSVKNSVVAVSAVDITVFE